MMYDFNDVYTLVRVRDALMQLMNEIDIELYSFSGFEKDYANFYSHLRTRILNYVKSKQFDLIKEYFSTTSHISAFSHIDDTIINYINFLAGKRYSSKLLYVSDKTIASDTVIMSLRQVLTSAESEYDYICEQYLI